MKRMLVLAVAGLMLISPVMAQELKKISLDDTSSIGLKIQSDATIKVEGKSSLKITTMWPTTVCLGEVSGLDIENAKLIYKAQLKADLQGSAYLEMWVRVDGGQYFSRGLNDQSQGKSEWKAIQTPFMFKKGQKPDKITLNVVAQKTAANLRSWLCLSQFLHAARDPENPKHRMQWQRRARNRSCK
jgi:hypothetical protein